jgi:hypothetical protein
MWFTETGNTGCAGNRCYWACLQVPELQKINSSQVTSAFGKKAIQAEGHSIVEGYTRARVQDRRITPAEPSSFFFALAFFYSHAAAFR